MNNVPLKPISILLIEDSPGDVELIREGLELGKVSVTLNVAADGEEGLAYLRQTGAHSDKLRPDLVLLDINLPKKNGHEVLQAIRADAKLTALPVIMLTTSDNDKDIFKSYNHHVNAYITKPVNATDFLAAVRDIEEFWLTLVKFPRNIT